jgi:hypothetical protein
MNSISVSRASVARLGEQGYAHVKETFFISQNLKRYLALFVGPRNAQSNIRLTYYFYSNINSVALCPFVKCGLQKAMDLGFRGRKNRFEI